MINLTTGQPGAGKSLYTLYYVQQLAEKENRPVYYSGIPDLKLPWIELDKPEEWYKLPPGAIIVLDECQRLFRPRGNGSQVPEHVAKLETHRHDGFDLFLITQHPMLVDTNVRRLIGRHFHVQRTFGMNRATVHEFPELRQEPDKTREGSIRHDFSYPKEVFDWYKSAEVHTVKRRIPARLYFLFSVPLILGAMVYGFYHWQMKQIHPDKGPTGAPVATAGTLPVSNPEPTPVSGPMSTEQYFQNETPRIPGLYYTAPKFDKVQEVRSAPLPKACIAMGNLCKCYTDQGTSLDVPTSICQDIIEHGLYDPSKAPASELKLNAPA